MAALAKMAVGSLFSNPAQMGETFTKLGRKLYTAWLGLIFLAWYTGWRRERGDTGSSIPIPGIAKKVRGNVFNLSTLPALQPFKAILPLDPGDGAGGATGATVATDPGVPNNLGTMPSNNLGGKTITILQAGRLAQSMGLRVAENPLFGGVTPGAHVAGSLHYSGRAIDVSAPMTKQGKALMAHYAAIMAANYGKHITELFWRGSGWIIIKNGVRQSNYNFVDGHQDHVHVGI